MNRLTKNYLLKALPDEEYKLMVPDLEEISLKSGSMINQPYQNIPYVYFPNNSVISVVAGNSDGGVSDVGLIGREGFLGISVLFGADNTPDESIVRLPGTAFRISTKIIRERFEQSPSLRKILLKFAHTYLLQISQTIICNNLHNTRERLAQWLLMMHDRSDSDVLPITQEQLANMLGVLRPTVSFEMARFKKQGLIKYIRGQITVLKREELEKTCCSCYHIVKEEYKKMFG